MRRPSHWFWVIIVIGLVLPWLTMLGAAISFEIQGTHPCARGNIFNIMFGHGFPEEIIFLSAWSVWPFLIYAFIAWGLLRIGMPRGWPMEWGVTGGTLGVSFVTIYLYGFHYSTTYCDENWELLYAPTVLAIRGGIAAAIGMAGGLLLARLARTLGQER